MDVKADDKCEKRMSPCSLFLKPYYLSLCFVTMAEVFSSFFPSLVNHVFFVRACLAQCVSHQVLVWVSNRDKRVILAVAHKPQGADLRASITSTMRARKETEGGRICNKNIRHGPQVVMLEGCFGRILIFAQRDRTRTLL